MEQQRARDLYERGHGRWPELPLSFESFLGHVQQHLPALADVDAAQICAEDLFLVAACLARVPGAVDQFVGSTWPPLERHLRRKEPDPQRLAEMKQALLVRLLVPDPGKGAPRIADYTGRGPLLVWLRMAATRLLFNARRDEQRLSGLGDSYANKAAAGDAELSFMRGHYAEEYALALREALAALSQEDRLLLQMSYHEQLTSQQIAVVFKTSKATANRRVAAARDALADHLRRRLQARLELSQTGLEQMMGLFSSSLSPALASELRRGLADVQPADGPAAARPKR
jgi:RNA polymerase sigma-70 factor